MEQDTLLRAGCKHFTRCRTRVCLVMTQLLSSPHLQVVQTLEDHHQEVLSLYRDFGFAGLIAQDSEFALCNVPAYFSSHALKLSWNGKNLTTHQYLLSEAARQLGLKTQHLPCFAALLGKEQHKLTHKYGKSNMYHTFL